MRCEAQAEPHNKAARVLKTHLWAALPRDNWILWDGALPSTAFGGPDLANKIRTPARFEFQMSDKQG